MTSRQLSLLLALFGASGCAAGGTPDNPSTDQNDGTSGSGTVSSGGAFASSGGFPGAISTGGTLSSGGFPTVPNTGGTPTSNGGSSGGTQTSTGGTPGGTATGGAPSGGGTGTMGSATEMPISADNLIDDLEDMDGSIDSTGGRDGAWYTYNDGTAAGMQTPLAGATFVPDMPGDNSMYAAHSSGSGFTTWGAGFGFDLNNNGTTKMPYDATAYTGIIFSAKGTPFRLKVLTSSTTPMTDGGTCMGTSAQCGDDFGTAIAATSDWKQYEISFASLKQEGWGIKSTFDASTVLGVQFQVGTKVTFDIWIDNVGFE